MAKATKISKQKPPQEKTRLVSTPGQWVERPRRTETLVCACGNRYIKTRRGQTTCVFCIARTMPR